MQRSLFAVLVGVVLLYVTPALSDTREERLAAARAYSELALEEYDHSSAISSLWKPVADHAEALGQPLSKEQLERLDALFQDVMAEPWRQVIREQDEVLADLMTLEEIEALVAFYSSAEGRAVMRKMPQLMNAQREQIDLLLQQKADQLAEQIEAIVEE